MTTSELEHLLREAKQQCDAFTSRARLASSTERDAYWREYRTLNDNRLEAERALAAARQEEFATPCPWPVPWDTGAPMPHFLCAGRRAFLLYYAWQDHGPGPWTVAQLRQPSKGAAEPVAVAEFTGCYMSKFGGPNDEVFEGHPLYGRGLDAYGAHFVEHSRWLAELEGINRVHRMYRPEIWRERKHYLLLFHDELFECLATGHAVEIFHEPMADLLTRYSQRIVD